MMVLAAAFLTGGCQSPVDNDMQMARSAYAAGEWQRAAPPARRVAGVGSYLRTEAAYIAGMSAYRMGDLDAAKIWLNTAKHDRNKDRAGVAYTTLGRIHADRKQYQRACDAYVQAAQRLTGQAQADAWFGAAEAARAMDRPSQARSYYTLARAASTDDDLRLKVEQALNVVGWTIQIGPYADKDQARAVAQLMAHQSRNLHIGDARLLTVVVEGGKRAYVVQVGQFARYETASEARKQINVNKTVIVPLNQWVKK